MRLFFEALFLPVGFLFVCFFLLFYGLVQLTTYATWLEEQKTVQYEDENQVCIQTKPAKSWDYTKYCTPRSN